MKTLDALELDAPQRAKIVLAFLLERGNVGADVTCIADRLRMHKRSVYLALAELRKRRIVPRREAGIGRRKVYVLDDVPNTGKETNSGQVDPVAAVVATTRGDARRIKRRSRPRARKVDDKERTR